MATPDHLTEKTQDSFMKSIFFGNIREELVFPFPKLNSETNETVGMIVDSVKKFGAEQVKSSDWDAKGEMPREIVNQLAELGMMGLAVPEDHGGLGLPIFGYGRVFQEVAALDGSLAVTLGAHQSIGYKALLLFGSDEQKKKYLPALASGEKIACYCLTEPGSGSDAASIKTRAQRSPDGKTYAISGNKLWITNGGIASFATVFAKVEVEEKGEKKDKVTCFILELPAPGITIGPPEHKLGIRASWTNAIHFDNVQIPAENIIGGVGKGFKVAMGVLNHGRLGLATGCVGAAKNCLKASLLHAEERVQFQKKLREFGMIRDKLGRMATNIYVAESMAYMTCGMVDRADVDYSIESAIAKVFASEMLWECADENLQIWAGSGYMKEYPYERWLRDSRINRIFEGTNEILRAFIALSGFQGLGQDLAGLADAIKHPLKGLGPVADYASRKFKQSVFGEKITRAHPLLKEGASMLEEFAVEFSSQCETLLRRHGREIYMKQMAQKRMANVAIDLFGTACVLSRVTAAIEKAGGNVAQCELEVAMAQTYFMMARSRIQANFKGITRNEDDHIELINKKLFESGEYPIDVLKA